MTKRAAKRYSRAHRPGAKKAAKKSARKRSAVHRLPAGYSTTSSGLLIPASDAGPVPAGKLRTGILEAQRDIDRTIGQLLHSISGDFEIKEIELTASFSADGKFLGFGVGGSASLKITIRPTAEA